MAQLENINAIEKRLWSAADTLRSNSNYASNEYFMPVMGLIFLRHAYSRYLAVKDEIRANLPTRGGKKRALSKEDFSQSGQRYDLILSTAGYRSVFDYRRALSPQGIYVSAGGAMAQVYQGMLLGPLISMTGSKTLTYLFARQNQQDLVFLRERIEAGKVKSVIDRRYPLSEAAEALRYYGAGHSQGKVVITLEHDSTGNDRDG